MKQVTLHSVVRDEGTIVVFQGADLNGRVLRIAVDHRCAQDIADAIGRGELPEAYIEDWQVLGCDLT